MDAIGIDIGGSSVKAALIGDWGVFTTRSAGYSAPDRDALVHSIRGCIEDLRSRCPGELHRDTPVGLCLPGRLGSHGEWIERSVNLPSLEGWRFERMLADTLGYVPASHRIVSDVLATAHDLVVRDGSRGRVAVIAIGTGVGLAVMDDGMPCTIGGRSIGHLGQIDVGRLGETDLVSSDGAVNTLECYVGLRALRTRMGAVDEPGITEAIAGLAVDDPFMLAIVRAIRIVHAIYAPDRICLAGGIGMLLAARGSEIRRLVDAGLTTLAKADWSLGYGDSLHHAAVGAARLALE